MLRKDFYNMCRLFKIKEEDIKKEKEGYFYEGKFLGKDSLDLFSNYHLLVLDKIDLDKLHNVIKNIEFIDCGSYGSRANTKEGYNFINSISKREFNNIKNISRDLLGRSIDDIELSFDNRRALKTIYSFLLKTMINKCEVYFEKEFDELYG